MRKKLVNLEEEEPGLRLSDDAFHLLLAQKTRSIRGYPKRSCQRRLVKSYRSQFEKRIYHCSL